MSNMTPTEYATTQKEIRVLNFARMALTIVASKQTMTEKEWLMEAQRLIHDLDEIDNADFEGGRYDEEYKPF